MFTGQTMVVDPATGFLTHDGKYATTGFGANDKLKFIAALAETYNVGKACKAARIDHATYNRHLEIDPAFKKAVSEALESHVDDAESELFQNAKRERGTADRIFLLKNRRKAIYGERQGLGIDRPEMLDLLANRLMKVVEAEIVPDELQPGYAGQPASETHLEINTLSACPLPDVQVPGPDPEKP